MKIFIVLALAMFSIVLCPGDVLCQLHARTDGDAVTPPPMRFNEEDLQQLMQEYEQADRAFISPEVSRGLSIAAEARIATSMDLLGLLPYVPEERHQGLCGNCWAWAGTGVMEIANTVQRGGGERQSIQFVNSCYTYPDDPKRWACCGGNLTRLSNFYLSRGYAIPWTNTNASYKDKTTSYQCANGPSESAQQCSGIQTTPNYPIESMTPATIATQGTGQSTAISNIKNVLNQNKGVFFTFFAANDADWDAFQDFWWDNNQTVLWNVDALCGASGTTSTLSGHAMLVVGYNDDDADPAKHYWIVLNSWGTASGRRPQGLLRMPMKMNYDCKLNISGYSPYSAFQFQTLSMTYEVPSVKVVKSGNGSGRVTSSPAGIDCGSACEGDFIEGTVVTLTASPNEGSVFAGWSGSGCSGTGTCQVTVSGGAVTVAAMFSRLYSLSVLKSGTGTGRVTSVPTGIDCGSTCSGYFAQGTSVALSAEPEGGSAFAGWSGSGCSGKGACTVTVNANTSVTAMFTPPCAYTLTSMSKNMNFRGGIVSVTVKANQKVCGPPDNVTTDSPWIELMSATWKNGQGVVKFKVLTTDRSALRTGKVFIAGHEFVVSQTGVVCAITKTVPASASFTNSGSEGTAAFDVYLNAVDCSWTTSTPYRWIGLETAGGTGSGTVYYSVEPNDTKKPRTSKIEVYLTPTKKKVFTVRQAK